MPAELAYLARSRAEIEAKRETARIVGYAKRYRQELSRYRRVNIDSLDSLPGNRTGNPEDSYIRKRGRTMRKITPEQLDSLVRVKVESGKRGREGRFAYLRDEIQTWQVGEVWDMFPDLKDREKDVVRALAENREVPPRERQSLRSMFSALVREARNTLGAGVSLRGEIRINEQTDEIYYLVKRER